MNQDEPGTSHRCKVCSHPDLPAIDAALVEGTSRRTVADRFGLHASSVQRHKDAHLSPALVQAMRSEPERAISVLDRVDSLANRVERMIDAAEAEGKPGLMLSGVKELRALLELSGKARGELKPDGVHVTFNLATNPEWLQARTVLVQALQPYPDAIEAVSTALLELEQ